MKAFLDTNVLVSAFATRGLCADLFRLALAEHELITTDIVLTELEGVLRERFGIPTDTVPPSTYYSATRSSPKPEKIPDIPVFRPGRRMSARLRAGH